MAENADEPPFFYVNAVQITGAPFDFTFDFGFKRPEDSRPGSTEYQRLVRLTMSPGHAKSLLRLLARQINAYEDKLGEIPSPDFGAQPE